MSFPSSAKKTGKSILGVEVFTSELCPNCSYSFVMSGAHKDTKERGWFAFCKKTGKLEHLGPYETFSKALRYMTLVKGCNRCEYNNSELKEDYLTILTKEVRNELSEIFGEGHTYSIIRGPLTSFVENRRVVDLLFRNIFGTRLFKSVPDDAVAVKDFMTPCTNENEFTHKISALAGMIDRIEETEVKKAIKNTDPSKIRGSLNILEQLLKENKPGYRSYIIQNLRHVISLRNKFYPVHSHSSEIITILSNLGIGNYPLIDWDTGWLKILNLCSASYRGLCKELQTMI